MLPEGVDPLDYGADAVIDRLKAAIRVRSDVDLAAALKVNKSTVSTWRSRGRVPYPEVVKVAVERGVSIDWMLTGRWLDKHSHGPTGGGIQLDVLAVVLYRVWNSPAMSSAEKYDQAWTRAVYRALLVQQEYQRELKQISDASTEGYSSREPYVQAMMRSLGIDPDADPL
ncbi:helix-turn-helix transcriptional regulator [Albidovulum sp.]|uniref:helix-turn-helix transcriptional regulator n=1 Tax=Albidovulum sp. TaxID=1872424 RepID=UPI0039B8C4EC